MNIQPIFKIFFIIIFSIFFGIGQAFIIQGNFLIQSFSSSLLPLIVIFVITFIAELSKTLTKKGYRFNDFINTSWKIFIPTIILFYFLLLVGYYSKFKEQSASSKNELYKKTVQQNNLSSKKNVGNVHSEFLNSDNLYENYSHNYTIMFPKNFHVNYGIGKYSEVQAYDSLIGYIIVVNVMNLESGIKPTANRTKNNISDTLIKALFTYYKDENYIHKLESTLEERGLSDVKHEQYHLTNYNNRIYISSRYTGNAIINNEKYPIILIDNVTFYDDKIYHFSFRSWKENFTKDWEKIINNTMALVLINDRITNQ